MLKTTNIFNFILSQNTKLPVIILKLILLQNFYKLMLNNINTIQFDIYRHNYIVYQLYN